VIEAITGEDRRTPEHVSQLGQAKDALEQVKKNGVPSGKREDILSAIPQLSLQGEDVDEDAPLGQQFHGLVGDGKPAITHDDPPAGDPDDPLVPDTTSSSGGGSSWIKDTSLTARPPRGTR
jgi:hypothetical protein